MAKVSIDKNPFLLIAKKELQKKWLMQNLLTGKKRLKGFEKEKWNRLGAGEILLTSMNNDGTKDGFAIDITKKISEALNVLSQLKIGVKQEIVKN